MPRFLFLAAGWLALSFSALAQSTNSASTIPQPSHDPQLAYLSQSEIDHLHSVHDKVMSANPGLRKQEEDLGVQYQIVRSPGATQDQIVAFREAALMFVGHVREAMLSLDPTVKPIIDKVDAHASEVRAQNQRAAAEAAAASAATNAPPAR